MVDAVRENNISLVRELLREHSDLIQVRYDTHITWLYEAAEKGSKELVDIFLDEGLDVNDYTSWQGPPLMAAIHGANVPIARYLLERGANPNLDRLLIAAINVRDRNASFQFVRMLVEVGIDVNLHWRMGEPNDVKAPFFNALSWAMVHGRDDLIEYLQAHGAKLPPLPNHLTEPVDRGELCGYFAKKIGKPRPEALVEIIPTSDPPIAVHEIPPSSKRNYVTLFTTGMSDAPMNVPPGAEAYRYAELVMFLPAKWPLTTATLAQPQHGWPLQAMRQIAAYPHREQSWLGAPIAIFAAEDPPQPYAPGCPFAAMLLIINLEELGPITASDGRLIHLYTLLPLYPEERLLELTQGLPELFKALDQHKVEKILDLKRPNVARP
jgi:hypothetical protein